MEMKFKKISAAFGVLVLSASLLSACSATSSQKAIIYIQDNTENRSIDGNLVINAAGNKPVDEKIISDAISVSKKNNKSSKTQWNSECDSGKGCSEFRGKPLYEASVNDYYDAGEGFEVALPLSDSGKVSLSIVDGSNTTIWELSAPEDKELPIYVFVAVDDFTIGVSQHLNGKVTFTNSLITSFEPGHTSYFEEEYKSVSKFRSERDNKWLLFSIMYRNYIDASDKASVDTCKVFGKDCNGKTSYANIGKAYRKAYDEILLPMLGSLITDSEDSKVSVALLKLEKAAKLEADCYFRTYTAANDKNDTAYSATSECFSGVKQQISDIEIYLKENSQSLQFPMLYGGY